MFVSLLGITWLRERLLIMFNEMFDLDIQHYCSTLLHPKYRSLKGCSDNEHSQCYKFIREQLNMTRSSTTQSTQERTPERKKLKETEHFFSRIENGYPINTSFIHPDGSGDESDEYKFDIKKSDELDRYLVMDIDRSSLPNDPLEFWKLQLENLPLLSKYAQRIHSIPATAASVKR